MSVFRHSSHVCSCPIFSYPSLANRRRRIHVRQSGRGGVGNWWNQHEVNARARRAPINAATKTIDSESTSVTERVRSFTLAGPPDVYNHRWQAPHELRGRFSCCQVHRQQSDFLYHRVASPHEFVLLGFAGRTSVLMASGQCNSTLKSQT